MDIVMVKRKCSLCRDLVSVPRHECNPLCGSCKEVEGEVVGRFCEFSACPYSPGSKYKVEWMRLRAEKRLPVQQRNDRRK